VAWLLLAACIQVYSENEEQNAEQKDVKDIRFSQKRLFKVVKRLAPLKKKKSFALGR
jgi:hypothetical protein